MNFLLYKIMLSTECVILWFVVCMLLLHGMDILVTGKESVRRLEGACKVMNVTDELSFIKVADFHKAPPEGYLLKTTIEIMLRSNMHNFEKQMVDENREPVSYNSKWKPITVRIEMSTVEGERDIQFEMGKKSDRMVKFVYMIGWKKTLVHKLNQFAPILPHFPYHLRTEITTSGAFSVYADSNEEPFFTYQIEEEIISIDSIHFNSFFREKKLVALLDCSTIGAPNCGTDRIERLYDCRESFAEQSDGVIFLTKANSAKFDEFFVMDQTTGPRIRFFYKNWHSISMEFDLDGIVIYLLDNYGRRIKTLRTSKRKEIPASPLAVRVEILNSPDAANNYLKISDINNDQILKLKLCWRFKPWRVVFRLVWSTAVPIYFDCVHPNNYPLNENRSRKYNGYKGILRNEVGHNFTRRFLDISDYVDERIPSVLYEFESGRTSEVDWCEGDPLPQMDKKGTLDIGQINTAILSELQSQHKVIVSKFESQNNLTADAFKAILLELQSIKAAIVTHNEVKASTIVPDTSTIIEHVTYKEILFPPPILK